MKPIPLFTKKAFLRWKEERCLVDEAYEDSAWELFRDYQTWAEAEIGAGRWAPLGTWSQWMQRSHQKITKEQVHANGESRMIWYAGIRLKPVPQTVIPESVQK